MYKPELLPIPECLKQYFEDKTSNISCMTPWRMSLTKGVQHEGKSIQPAKCTEEQVLSAHRMEARYINQYLTEEACPGNGLNKCTNNKPKL